MKKRLNSIMAKLLVFMMVFQLAVPISVSAAEPDNTGAEGNLSSEFTIEHVESGKLVKTYETSGKNLTVDGAEGDTGTVFKDAVFGINDNNAMGNNALPVVSLVSKDYGNGIATAYWNNSAVTDYVKVNDSIAGTGWESIQIVANGDGTVSFKDVYYDKYITVTDVDDVPTLTCGKDTLTKDEKFIIHSSVNPTKVEDLAVTSSTRTQTTLDLTWSKPSCIYTNIQVYQKEPDDFAYKKIANLGDETSYQVTGLEAGTEYSFKLVVVNGNGDPEDTSYATESNKVTAKTRAGEKPATPTGVTLEEGENNTFTISWEAAEHATGYEVMRAESMFGEYKKVAETTTTSVDVTYEDDKYTNYYRVVALNVGEKGTEISEESDFVSVEKNMFGDHTLVFAPTDDATKIDETLEAIFEDANDLSKDAQFSGEHWQIYFKPGDYTDTSCIDLGFYTAINGLGETPYDVELNNVAIPDYMGGNNATCNFWRSMENVSIINTGNEQGKAQHGSWRPDWFNWAVAQAAPLRRVYSERPVAYDWNWGWASGGYVADCYFKGSEYDAGQDANMSAGTWSGQQFYTRNSKMDGNVFGTTLNNFFQGVIAPNLPDADGVEAGTSRELFGAKGYSNWKIPNAEGEQQVFTNVEETKKIAEKPFVFLDDGEYKVFVPSVRENTKGTSWSENNMGEGEVLSLDEFYIASPEDSAATINAQLEAGKNIYFTPGVYHAEETIKVNNPDTILLGTGLATIIPDNEDAAMRVADVDGVRIAGLIFDAGEYSESLLVVGDEESGADHSADPTILQDVFFRVGGTTDELTKADDALIINSNDVIGDHFWIWRADHGAGVAWDGNESKHGLIVNGDNVTCYALFNEHFQEYNTLWNGENGETYFYQNETPYDPISQEAWMSHDGAVNGYASYKVADEVNKHYAIGLGIYNVFTNCGPTRDSSEVQIQLDNAIEVPDKEGVMIENACLQTFAKADGALQKINSVVNGLGDPVSSGVDSVTGETGTDWDRSFLLYYRNGEAEGSYREMDKAYQALEDAYNDIKAKFENVTDSEEKAELEQALKDVEEKMSKLEVSVTWPIEEETKELVTSLNETISNLEETAFSTAKAVLLKEIESVSNNGLVEDDYTADSWAKYQEAITAAKAVAEKENQTVDEMTAAVAGIQEAIDALIPVIVEVTSVTLDKETLSLVAGASADLVATVAPENATNKTVTWTTDNAKVATVANGKVTAVAAGTAKITATAGEKTATCTVTVTAPEPTTVAVTDVTLDKSSLTINRGKTETLKATVTPADATDKTITWESSNEKVATVVDGKVTAVAKGTAKITATVGGKTSLPCTVTVKVPSTKVKLNTKTIYVVKGKSVKVKATMTPADTTDTLKISKNSKSTVATASLKKNIITIKAKKVGKTTITVKTTSGKSVSCTINVVQKAKKSTNIKLNKKTLSIKKGASYDLVPTLTPKTSTDTIKWTSSNKKIAKVDDYGTVTGLKGGTVTITAKSSSGKKTTCKVTVKEASTKVKLNKTKVTVNVKKSVTLKATLTPTSSTDKVTWKSSNTKVATVSSKGKVTGKKKGTATITVKTTSGKTATCKVTVK